jgi:hypothetical protein
MSLTRLQSRLALPAVLLAGALAAAPAASADVGETIIQRCTHGQSLGGFSQSAYSKALKELSADAEEYTSCASLIRQAQLAAAGRGSGGGASTGAENAVPLQATPAELRSISSAPHAGSAPIQLGGQTVHPGVVHANIASALSSLPSPLLATLAFLLACLLLMAGGAARNRFRGHRPD